MPEFTRDSETQIEALALKLSRRQVTGSLNVTMETARLIRNVISSSHWNDPASLIMIVKEVQQRLMKAQPIELSIASTSQRIVQMIRDESNALRSETPWPVLRNSEDEKSSPSDTDFKDSMKTLMRQAILELMDEQDTANFNIATQARDHIHSNEIIMTIGRSKVVTQFLKEAARVRKFQVIVAETAPMYIES